MEKQDNDTTGKQTDVKVLREISPLMQNDFMYVADRRKHEFTYPIHKHEVFELNFVENAAGVVRIVGDSTEIITDYDLVLITSPDLEHVWTQGTCQNTNIREITVQFYFDFLSEDSLFNRNSLHSIKNMFEKAQKGLSFPLNTIMQIYPHLNRLSSQKDSFYAMIELLTILYEMSQSNGMRELASSTFAKVDVDSDSRRILKVKDYISKHFTEEVRLTELSDLIGMSPSAFSRFFKLSTGKTLSEYTVGVRLGMAARKLVDTTDSISEICYCCGFNTLSNFNRLFRKYKGCSPSEFRDKYHKKKVIM